MIKHSLLSTLIYLTYLCTPLYAVSPLHDKLNTLENQITIEVVEDKVIAIRGRMGNLTTLLDIGEQVRSVKNLGIIGAVLTDYRFLVTSVTSKQWHSIQKPISAGPTGKTIVTEKMALLLTNERAIGFDGINDTLAHYNFSVKERIFTTQAGPNLMVLTTEHRAAAFAVGSTDWKEIAFDVEEIFQSIKLDSAQAVIETSDRFLTYKIISDSWQQIQKPPNMRP